MQPFRFKQIDNPGREWVVRSDNGEINPVFFGKRVSFGRSFAGIETFSAISCVPAFPGAQKMRSASGDCASFRTRACSRPPLPTTRTFTGASVRQPEAKNKLVAAIQKGP